MKKYTTYILPIIGALALLYVIFVPSEKTVKESAAVFSNYIIQQEKKFTEILPGLADTLCTNADLIAYKENKDLPFDLLLYKNDSIIAYTSNRSIPTLPVSLIEQRSVIISLNNGWYFLQKSKKNDSEIVALSLLKDNFKIENEFLKNQIHFSNTISSNLAISDQNIAGSIPIRNIDGKNVGYVYINSTLPDVTLNIYSLFSILAILCIALFYIWQLCFNVAQKLNPLAGFGLMAILLFSVRVIMISGEFPKELSQLQLFSPTLYASSYFANSLGQLFISILFLLLLAGFATYINIKDFIVTKHSKFLTGVMGLLTALLTTVLAVLFHSLILDSIISLELYDVISLSAYSMLALLCIILYLVIHFLFSKITFSIGLKKENIKLFLICTLLFMLIFEYWFLGIDEIAVSIYSCLWILVFIFISYQLIESRGKWIFSWSLSPMVLFMYSILMMFLLENFYETKERQQRLFFGNKLVAGHNYAAEYGFKEISNQLKTDKFLQSYFSSNLIGYRELKERLSVIYLKNYFQNYDYDIYFFDKQNNCIKSSDSLAERQIVDKIKYINNDSLIFLEDSVFQTGYLGFLQLKDDTTFWGKAAFLFKPKLYNTQNVYPELLVNNRIWAGNTKKNYNYAIYSNDKLLIQNGDYPYPYYWDKAMDNESWKTYFMDTKAWEHLVIKENNVKKVIVSIEQEGFFEPLASFSYFFIVLTFFTTLAWLINQFVLKKRLNRDNDEIIKMSFQSKIQLAMLSIIAFSFLVIGIITVSFIHKQYDNYYSERFSRKVKSILTGLEYVLEDKGLKSNDRSDVLQIEAAKLSEINNIDINIFNTSGELALSTRPEIYTNGLISKMMSPIAFDKMTISKENQFVQPEKIGTLDYSSFYVPLRNKQKNTLGFVNIPYFEKSKDVDSEVSSFLVTLLNVYAFLFLCAGIISFFISNSITRPLRFISEKIRRLNLDKRNEPIQWKSNDEIGRLINEYNKMIYALEDSAKQLAKSERETAWRQMARQIAHEIKNPLTPMKLSIQYLQRAIDENNPNVNEMAKKVNRTLIEQIDNLSAIATAFSSFAQMPKPNNEYIDLNITISDIVGLFQNEGEVKLTFNAYIPTADVFADKNQLISVFNNLIKNAIQSIPEDKEGLIDVIVLEEYGQIKVVVMDNGSGIPKDQHDKVFVPNFTTKSSGTGLGLAISKQIIDNSKGKIWFESEVGTGTKFYVTLPSVIPS